MSTYVLDTDTLSLLQEGHAAVVSRVANCAVEDLAITVISVEEQLSGWYRQLRLAKKPEQLAKIYEYLSFSVRSLSRLPILSFSEAAIRQVKTLQGLNLNVRKMDLSIAAIALEHRAIVVTRNTRDFKRVPNLTVEDWSN
jgi:tRNA(fMet)-specific endonuclease VapC